MTDSILDSIKLALGLPPDYAAFDPAIVMHINSAFGTANQLGLGPPQGFKIQDNSTTWDAFLNDDRMEEVKAYIYLKVRLLFDPPTLSFVLTALQEQARELEWRLNVKREDEEWTHPTPQ